MEISHRESRVEKSNMSSCQHDPIFDLEGKMLTSEIFSLQSAPCVDVARRSLERAGIGGGRGGMESSMTSSSF